MESRTDIENKIRDLISSLSPWEALSILTDLSKEVLKRIGNSREVFEKRTHPKILNLRGSISKVEQDVEIKDYILSLTEMTTLAQLRSDLVNRFGERRVPSKSSLHRYLLKMEGRA